MKRFSFIAAARQFIVAGCLLLNMECGVTVGNSGPPPVTSPDPTSPASSEDETASLVAMQMDETLGTSDDQSAKDASSAPALTQRLLPLVDPLETAVCTSDPVTGTAKLEGSLKASSQVTSGKTAERRLVTDETQKDYSIVFSQVDGLQPITCNGKDRPILGLAQLAKLKTTEAIQRTRKRVVTLQSDGSTLRSNTLVASTQRTSSFSRDLLNLTSLTYSKSTSFETSVQLTEGADVTRERKVKTLSEDPIILQRTVKRGEGLKEARIVSGSTESYKADGKRVVLHYKDLQLAIGGESCLPTSGSIAGEIFADQTTKTPEKTLVVTFSEGGASVSVNGEAEVAIDLETCKL